MATPWKYTGQLVPRAKQAGGTAALEHPAREIYYSCVVRLHKPARLPVHFTMYTKDAVTGLTRPDSG